ncbi:hypothetical protein DFH27DRAFT_307399 [Peziza echinospora]|nr:hypothetical protein DFH27DRAFT_307399 [Peziza echinospora]
MATVTATTNSDEGASIRELLLEASRRDNITLLLETLETIPPTEAGHILNTSTDALGQTPLHVAAGTGSYEVLDHLLDTDNLEVDPVDRLHRETPLHKAVKYANEKDLEVGSQVVELLLDAGADPKVRNKLGQRPVDLVDPRNKALKEVLDQAEYKMDEGDDVVNEDEDDDGSAGSGSESE